MCKSIKILLQTLTCANTVGSLVFLIVVGQIWYTGSGRFKALALFFNSFLGSICCGFGIFFLILSNGIYKYNLLIYNNFFQLLTIHIQTLTIEFIDDCCNFVILPSAKTWPGERGDNTLGSWEDVEILVCKFNNEDILEFTLSLLLKFEVFLGSISKLLSAVFGFWLITGVIAFKLFFICDSSLSLLIILWFDDKTEFICLSFSL